MKVKVFQLQQKAFDSKGNIIPKDKRKNKIVCIGTVIVPKNKRKDFVREAIWDLFNWTCWWRAKFNTYLKGIRKGFRRRGYILMKKL